MKSFLAAALLSTAVVGIAHAAQTDMPPPPAGQKAQPPMPGMGPGRGMQRIDTDGDGRISRAEFAAASQQRFERMDANGDGFLDATEAAPRGGRMGGRPDGPND